MLKWTEYLFCSTKDYLDNSKHKCPHHFKTAPDAGFNVAAPEGSHLPQLSGHLHTVMEEQTQAPLVRETVCVRDQTEQNCDNKRDTT